LKCNYHRRVLIRLFRMPANGVRSGPREWTQVDLAAETAPCHEPYIARRVNLPQAGALAENPNHVHIPRRPASIRGALRDRHERGKRDAMDAMAHETNASMRRRSRVVLAPLGWC
jgi:hypothetical protein